MARTNEQMAETQKAAGPIGSDMAAKMATQAVAVIRDFPASEWPQQQAIAQRVIDHLTAAFELDVVEPGGLIVPGESDG